MRQRPAHAREWPPSGGKAVGWTVAAAFGLWLLLPVAVHYQRRARSEATEAEGRYHWPKTVWTRPILLVVVVSVVSVPAALLAFSLPALLGGNTFEVRGRVVSVDRAPVGQGGVEYEICVDDASIIRSPRKGDEGKLIGFRCLDGFQGDDPVVPSSGDCVLLETEGESNRLAVRQTTGCAANP